MHLMPKRKQSTIVSILRSVHTDPPRTVFMECYPTLWQADMWTNCDYVSVLPCGNWSRIHRAKFEDTFDCENYNRAVDRKKSK